MNTNMNTNMRISMKSAVGDTVQMKKNHPCGGDMFVVLRIGMDFRLRCKHCGHEVMMPRTKTEKAIKQVFPADLTDPVGRL